MSKRIIELYFERDERAIEETEIEYGKLIRQLSRSLLNSDRDVEECINDTYLQVWNTIPPNRPDSLKAYICKIARNLSLNRLKYLHAEKRYSGQIDTILDELNEIIPSNENVEEAVERSALSEHINEFLRAQSETNRIIFIKRYWLFMPANEIAKDMHISLTKVTSSLHRTRQRLKNHLEEKEYII